MTPFMYFYQSWILILSIHSRVTEFKTHNKHKISNDIEVTMQTTEDNVKVDKVSLTKQDDVDNNEKVHDAKNMTKDAKVQPTNKDNEQDVQRIEDAIEEVNATLNKQVIVVKNVQDDKKQGNVVKNVQNNNDQEVPEKKQDKEATKQPEIKTTEKIEITRETITKPGKSSVQDITIKEEILKKDKQEMSPAERRKCLIKKQKKMLRKIQKRKKKKSVKGNKSANKKNDIQKHVNEKGEAINNKAHNGKQRTVELKNKINFGYDDTDSDYINDKMVKGGHLHNKRAQNNANGRKPLYTNKHSRYEDDWSNDYDAYNYNRKNKHVDDSFSSEIHSGKGYNDNTYDYSAYYKSDWFNRFNSKRNLGDGKSRKEEEKARIKRQKDIAYEVEESDSCWWRRKSYL